MGGHGLGQLHGELHLGGAGLIDGVTLAVCQDLGGDGEGTGIGANHFQLVAGAELVVQTAHGQAVFVAGLHLGHDLPLPDVTGMLRILAGLAEIEAGGIDSVGNMIHLVPPDPVDLPAGVDIIQHMAVSAGDDGGIIGGFGAAFDLDAIDAGIHQLLQMVDGAHIPGIEDVGALFVFKDGEVFAGALFFH